MIPSTSSQLLKLKLPWKILDAEEKSRFLLLNKNKITKPAQIKIIDLRKEPKESITKKLLNISSKRKISLSTKIVLEKLKVMTNIQQSHTDFF